MIRTYLFHLVRLLLGVTFLFSGLLKIRLPYDFLAIVCDYRIFGPHESVIVAALAPWVEVVIGVCLLSQLVVTGAFLLATVLSIAFVVIVGSAVYRQLTIKCGCFLSNDNVSVITMLRSSLVLLAAIIGLMLSLQIARIKASAET